MNREDAPPVRDVGTLTAVATAQRAALHTLLQRMPNIRPLVAAHTGCAALDLVRALGPDLLLLDLSLPDADGFTIAQGALHLRPGLRVVLITSADHPEYVLQALRCGIVGYLPPTTPADEFIQSLQRILVGETVFDRAIATRALQALVALPLPALPA